MAGIGQAILLGCQHGDENCWQEVFYAYFPLVKWVVRHTLYQIDEFTIGSISQDTMVALVESIDRISDERHLKRFLTRVARNKCIDYIRQNKIQFEEIREDFPDEHDEPANEEVAQALHQAMTHLQEPCNSLIRRRYLDGVSYRELAAEFHVGIEQIGIRLSRCLGTLREMLKRQGISWEGVL